MRYIKFSLVLLICFFTVGVNAQKIGVRAELDSAVIVIGDQSALTFQIEQMPNERVVAPVFSDTVPGGLELVGVVRIDTVKANDGLISITHRYIVTAFEEALYQVPQLPFVAGTDTVYSNSVSIKVVQPFQIDTALHTFTDIKPVINPPFDWIKFFKTVLLIALVLAIIVLIVVVVRRFVHRKPIFEKKEPEVIIPADVIAVSKLDKIKQEKLWQSGRVKEYHTQITEVIREYVERMFNINSLEMTSDEILGSLDTLKNSKRAAFDGLKQILKLGDLVKFAKFSPLPDENELSLINAYLFVNQTKIEEIKSIEEQKKNAANVSQEEKPDETKKENE